MRDTLTYGYNTNDEVAATAAGGDQYAYAYDDFGRIIAWTSTDIGGTYRYTYDNAGNRIAMADAIGNSTTYTYDTTNRELSQASTGSSGTETITRSYDNTTGCGHCIGMLTQMTDPTGSTTYTYDIRGSLLSGVKTIGQGTYPTSRIYDANGNPISITYPSGRTVNYTYDLADRPVSAATTTTTYASAVTYEPFGPIKSITYGNGTTRLITYDLRYEQTENKLVFTNNQNGTPIVDFGYQHDLDSNISGVNDRLNPPAPGSSLGPYDRAYYYDSGSGNRITEADAGSALWGAPPSSPSPCVGQYCFGSDGTIASIQLGTQPTTTFTYGSTAQLLSYKDGTGSSVPVSYDADGSESVVGPSSYGYSPRELLRSGDTITYGYDGDNVRTTTSQTVGASTSSRFSIYSPDLNLLEETSVTTGTPTAAYDYIWLAGLPIAQEDIASGQTHWTLSDYLGTPIVQTNGSGAIYWQADQTPGGEIFNNALRVGTSIHQPLRYPGQEAEQFSNANSPDGDTGRYYNIHRWYRPHLQRFSQTDLTGSQSGPNPYAYVFNRPTRLKDMLGLNSGCEEFSGQLYCDGVSEGADNASFGDFVDQLGEVGLTVGGTVTGLNEIGGLLALGRFGIVAGASALVTAFGLSEEEEQPSECDLFVATPQGKVFPVPRGAIGPLDTDAPGSQYVGGSGGNGLSPRVIGLRLMDPNQYSGSRGIYMNQYGQTVDPYTGDTISYTDPNAHISFWP